MQIYRLGIRWIAGQRVGSRWPGVAGVSERLECKNVSRAFHSEILTPSARYTILSRLCSWLSSRLAPRGFVVLRLERERREKSGEEDKEKEREGTAASQATPGLIHVVPVAREGAQEGGGPWMERGAGHPLAR